MQTGNQNKTIIEEDTTLLSKKIEIVGLYDPEENDLTIDMWSNSDGEKILELFDKIQKIKLSNDAKEILNISLLTNSYFPKKNISKENFLKLKSDWLLKSKNLKLIEDYVIKNQNINQDFELVKFLVDDYLSRSKLEKSCEIFSKIKTVIKDDYLSKFNIYCLVNLNKREEAQLQLDLKKEFGFKDIFFEEKFNYLMEYDLKTDGKISEKSILDFHLSHRTNPDFKFEPNQSTTKSVWRYLSTSNLLDSIESVDLEDLNKIATIEKATHEKHYPEKELYDLYRRFQFTINQLLSVKESYKLLPSIEARALIYQGILITNEIEPKLDLVKILKDSFTKDEIENAFQDELFEILNEINIEDVPSNYTSFYSAFINKAKVDSTKIKINNKIIHQSKLLNYFRSNTIKSNIKKELKDILKKAKKDKSYYISTKDIILLESLKSDGFSIPKKYENLYTIDKYNIPIDIQIYINNNEMGLVLLRLVEVIGEDTLENIGTDTLYFIISALNQLNIDTLRNKILLKVLPLKV